MSSGKLIARVWEVWVWLLEASFVLLCIRFLVAEREAVFPDVLPVALLALGSAALSAWRPTPALFAFVVSFPLLSGLHYIGLEGIPSPVSIVFAGVFLGSRIGRGAECISRAMAIGRAPQEPQSADIIRESCIEVVAVEILISVVLLSLIAQLYLHLGTPRMWIVLFRQPEFGFGDPLYFLTSAFVWMQGLFLFRMLRARGALVLDWLPSTLGVYLGTFLIFLIIQALFRYPETNQSIAPNKLFSPLEDIHSFGSFAVSLFAFATASFHRKSTTQAIANGACIAVLLLLVIVSWSRSTWLSGVITMFFIAWMRLPKRWTGVFLAISAILILLLNLNSNRVSWQHNEYLMRLTDLVRIENLTNKSPERVNLYHRAVAMIEERPIVGHLIGSFYLTSVRFTVAGSPYAAEPNFAHNFLLQFAAEMGLPSAMLFLALIGVAIFRGNRVGNERPGRVGPIGASAQSSCAPRQGHAISGVTMALLAYIITQMTANSLNIYTSNQFLFWFLMAAAFCSDAAPRAAAEISSDL